MHRIQFLFIVITYRSNLADFLVKEFQMFKVTFYVYSKILNKEFRNVEIHKSLADANLRALALMWQIESVEAI